MRRRTVAEVARQCLAEARPGHPLSMTDLQIACVERQARCFARPVIGSEADRAVHAIVAWELVQPNVTPDRRAAVLAVGRVWRMSA